MCSPCCAGCYETYKGSPASKGQLQHDLWGVKAPSTRWNWDGLRADIAKQGLRNSLLVAPMPTASTSQARDLDIPKTPDMGAWPGFTLPAAQARPGKWLQHALWPRWGSRVLPVLPCVVWVIASRLCVSHHSASTSQASLARLLTAFTLPDAHGLGAAACRAL